MDDRKLIGPGLFRAGRVCGRETGASVAYSASGAGIAVVLSNALVELRPRHSAQLPRRGYHCDSTDTVMMLTPRFDAGRACVPPVRMKRTP